MAEALLQLTENGLYCPTGDFYIDPWRPVTRAVITHAHSDHARPGSSRYLTSPAVSPRCVCGLDQGRASLPSLLAKRLTSTASTCRSTLPVICLARLKCVWSMVA